MKPEFRESPTASGLIRDRMMLRNDDISSSRGIISVSDSGLKWSFIAVNKSINALIECKKLYHILTCCRTLIFRLFMRIKIIMFQYVNNKAQNILALRKYRVSLQHQHQCQHQCSRSQEHTYSQNCR